MLNQLKNNSPTRLFVICVLLFSGTYAPFGVGQDVTIETTGEPIVVATAADLSGVVRDGVSVLIKTGDEAGLWRYSKASSATVDGTTVLDGPNSVGRFLVITGSDAVVSVAKVTNVAAVADLFAYSTAVDNQLFQTQGYSTEGIGANLYRYDAGSSATIDGGFVLPGVGGSLSFSGTTFNGTAGTGRFVAVDQSAVVPSQFGTIGSADDSNVLMRCVAALSSGSTLRLDPGQTYILDDQAGLYATLHFDSLTDVRIEGNGAMIQAKSGMSADNGTNLLWFQACQRFHISNLIVDGNRTNRTPAGEKTTYNLLFENCDWFHLENVKSINSCIDGFYLGATDQNNTSTFCTHFEINNCFADNCWRQGMSIINAYNVNVNGGAYTNTNGTAPQAGIDIEANANPVGGEISNRNIAINGVELSGNAGQGIVLAGLYASGLSITNCDFYGNNGAADIQAQCVFKGNYIHDTTTATLAALVYVGASTRANGTIISGNRFASNSVAKPCIYTHQAASYIVVSDNTADDNDYFIVSYAPHSTISNNVVSASRNTGVGFGQVLDGPTVITGNVIDGWVGRALYIGGQVLITDNVIKNGTPISFAAIDCAGSLGTISIRGNLLENDISTAGYAIRSDSGTNVVFRDNQVVNFSQTWWNDNTGTIDREDVINVKAYGAAGDGVTDDTAALQFAFNSANGKPIYLPTGTYLISSYLYVPASSTKFRLYGDGRNSSIIDASTLALGVVAIDISDSTFSHLHDFSIEGANSASLGGHAIWGVDPNWSSGSYLPQQVILERLYITGFKGYKTMSGVIRGGTSPANDLVDMPAVGIMLGQALQVKISDCYVANCDFGIYLYDCFQPLVIGNGVASCSIAGIVDEVGESPSFMKNDIVGCATTPLQSFTTFLATPRNGITTILTGGIVVCGSVAASISQNKIKNSYNAIVSECENPPTIDSNWIRSDVKTGIYSYGQVNVRNNTFDPSYVGFFTMTADDTTDVITTSADHGYSDGEEVFFWTTTTLPAGIFPGTRYYVRDSTANTFKVEESIGSGAVNLTSTGTGTHYTGICRRQIYWYLPAGGMMAHIGSVVNNKFMFNGGGVHFATMEIRSAGSAIDGIISGNIVGESTAQANVTQLDYFVLSTSVLRNLVIENNVAYASTNVTIVSKSYLSGSTSLSPGPTYRNNVFFDNGGTLGGDPTMPAAGPYLLIEDGVTYREGNVKELQGAGTPEGSISANIGSRYYRTDGGASTVLYVKESGTGNTGWAAK